MTAYFRKSFKVAPGVHINLSKRGTGISLGGRGAHVSFSPTGRITKTVSLPGTGIYYRDVSTANSRRSQNSANSPESPQEIPASSTTAAPAIHQVAAVEHHGFYISHGMAALFSLLASGIVALTQKSQPIGIWVPILAMLGGFFLILWSRDLATSKKEPPTVTD